MTSSAASRGKLGLALGGGGALGLAHIGVLRVLEEHGISADIVAGTSIGALVGAAHVFNKLDQLEAAARRVNWLEAIRLMDMQFGKSGLMGGSAILREIRRYIGDATFDDADRRFAVVAADLARAEEVVIRSGPVANAVRASISIPGIFTPVARNGQLLVDGGIMNPVPITVCRDMGANVVIAVDVTGDYAGHAVSAGIVAGEDFTGGIVEIVTTAMAMIMKQLASARSVTSPADVLIVPKVGHVRPYAFQKAAELIDAGRHAALAAISDIDRVTGTASSGSPVVES